MGHKAKVIFSKTGDMRFISHLDLMRMFHRACRRAHLPVTITKGFSPHLKISIPKALKLGVESANEEAVLSLDERCDPGAIERSLNASLPDGVRVMRVDEIE